MGLSTGCSASGMFAQASTDYFYGVFTQDSLVPSADYFLAEGDAVDSVFTPNSLPLLRHANSTEEDGSVDSLFTPNRLLLFRLPKTTQSKRCVHEIDFRFFCMRIWLTRTAQSTCCLHQVSNLPHLQQANPVDKGDAVETLFISELTVTFA